MNFPRTRTSLRCTLDAAAQEVDVAHPQRDDLTSSPPTPSSSTSVGATPPSLASMSVAPHADTHRAGVPAWATSHGFAAFSRRR